MKQPNKINAAPAWMIYPAILLLPFVLFSWLFLLTDQTSFGFDYWNHHIQDQLEVAFAIKTGTFPLFIPGYFHGQTAFVLSEGQIFHPLFHIATRIPGYWDGYAAVYAMAFHLLGLALSHAALFVFLRKLRLGISVAFLISLLTVYNLNLLSLSWFGSPIEAWSGVILSCAAIGCYYITPTGYKGPLFIIIAIYWLVGCGHPVWAYYGLIAVGLFTALLPFFIASILPEHKPEPWRVLRFWGKTGIFCLTGLLLLSAYIIPYAWDFIRTNSGIVDQPYQWTYSQAETFGEFLNNFFRPLRTGLSMFAGTPILIMVLLVPLLKLLRVHIPFIIWTILGVILLLFLYMQGPGTPVHFLAWNYLPLNQITRGPYRMGIALPVLFMMVLVWIMGESAQGETMLSVKGRRISGQTLLGVTSLLVFLLGTSFLPESLTMAMTPHVKYNFLRLPSWVEPLSVIVGALSLIMLAFHGAIAESLNTKRSFAAGLIILVCLHLLVIFRYNHLYYSPLEMRTRAATFDEMAAWKKGTMDIQMAHYYLNPGRGNETVVRQLKNYFVEPHLGKIYRKHVPATDRNDAYRILNQTRHPDAVVLENLEPGFSPPGSGSSVSDKPDRVTLLYSSYNRMIFEASAGQPAFFVFAYPYTGNWSAWVNDSRVPTYPANGSSHGVMIPSGTSRIEFRYWSDAAFAGMITSCVTFGLAALLFGLKSAGRQGACWAGAVAFIGAGCLFLIWLNSLYGGENLQTVYTWESPAHNAPINMAYGKPTSMSSAKSGDLWFPERYNSRHAVDGDNRNSISSSAHTDLERNPWWEVDLQTPTAVKTVSIYLADAPGYLPFNTFPLMVSYSSNGDDWEAGLVEKETNSIHLTFQDPVIMRYLNITASGNCILAINEVEVYADNTQPR